MTLSPLIRFEVIKRDRYTCSYCGKHPPDVLLEVDHIVPRAAGGSDDLTNLTTACTDCNRGKGARLLEEGTGPSVSRSAILEMQERIEQAKAYMEVLGGLEAITEQQIRRVMEAWAKAFGATIEERDDGSYWVFKGYGYQYGGHWPDERSVKQFIKKLSLEQVLDAVDITAAKMHSATKDATRYFYGVCHRSIQQNREPLSQAPSLSLAEEQAAKEDPDLSDAWYEEGVSYEHYRLGKILKSWADNGYTSLEDAVLGLWPED